MTLEIEIPLFKRVELGQETIQNNYEVLQFFVNKDVEIAIHNT